MLIVLIGLCLGYYSALLDVSGWGFHGVGMGEIEESNNNSAHCGRVMGFKENVYGCHFPMMGSEPSRYHGPCMSMERSRYSALQPRRPSKGVHKSSGTGNVSSRTPSRDTTPMVDSGTGTI